MKFKSDWLFLGLIFLTVVAVKLRPAIIGFYETLSPDACGYLDIARNIAAGRGIVSSFNLYQYWVGQKYYPALPYMQSLFSIVSAPLLYIFKWPQSINILNVLFSGFNALLIYRLLINRYNKKVVFWSALLVGISPQMQYTAIVAWSEQLHLLILLISLILVVRALESNKEIKLFWAGLLMGLNLLVRVANVYAILVFSLAIFLLKGTTRKIIKKIAVFLGGVGVVVVPYEFFCLSVYKEIYPAYLLKAVKAYRLSVIMPGAYYETVKPALRISSVQLMSNLGIFVRNFILHIIDFLKNLGPLSLLILPMGVWVFFRRRLMEVILFSLGIITILGHSLSLYWLPDIEGFRYSLIPAVSFIPLALIMSDESKNLFKRNFFRRISPVFIYAVVVLFIMYGGYAFEQNKSYGKQQMLDQQRRVDEVYEWIEKHIPGDSLVATDCIRVIFNLNRPIVSLPVGKALTGENIMSFLKIYKPECILTIDKNYQKNQKFLRSLGYRLELEKSPFFVFKRMAKLAQ